MYQLGVFGGLAAIIAGLILGFGFWPAVLVIAGLALLGWTTRKQWLSD